MPVILVECIGIDITDSSAVQDLVEELISAMGRSMSLVNNAVLWDL